MAMMTDDRPSDLVLNNAFENAIGRGSFTRESQGNWVYMHSLSGFDFFKLHSGSTYIQVPNLIQLDKY